MGRGADIAKRAIERFSGGDNGTEITFTNVASPPESVTVKGMVTRHHLQVTGWVNGGGPAVAVNGRTASCSVSEQLFADAGFVVRNGDDEVDMKDYRVSWADSAGIEREYVVSMSYADELVGHIVLICGGVE